MIAMTGPPLLIVRRELVLRPAGNPAAQLREWQTPSIRGLIMRRMRRSHCRDSDRSRCRGCPDGGACLYAEAFEPPAGRPHAVVVQTPFPNPLLAPDPAGLPVRLTAIGPLAESLLAAAEGALRDAASAEGVGPNRLRLQAAPSIAWRSELDLAAIVEAPAAASGGGRRVRVAVPWPLVLRDRRLPGHPLVKQPGWADLHHAACNLLLRAARHWGSLDLPRPQPAAARPVIASDWRAFRSTVYSTRTESARPVEGVRGHALYDGVPPAEEALVAAAGLLHVGEERRDGAGGLVVT